jgi:hypothetical protein
MQIAFFASSLVSAYWTLSDRCHRITFYERHACERKQHLEFRAIAGANREMAAAEGVH